MDYYELLGVSPSASQAEIRRAYRQLSFAYHPDKNPTREAEELYKEINAAYDVLGDPEKRRAYDLRGVFQPAEVAPQAEPHRDPRYRRRTPGSHASQRSEKYTIAEVMTICMKYLMWVNWIGIVVSSLYAIDYFLPYAQTRETIIDSDIVVVRGRYSDIRYLIAATDQGTDVAVYESNFEAFAVGKALTIARTQIYSTIMWAQADDERKPLILSRIYRTLAIFPVGLLLASYTSVVFRKRLQLSFNFSIVCVIFLLITLVFVL